MEYLRKIRGEEDQERIKIEIEIKPKKNPKIFCNICGKSYTRTNITHHYKTQSHNIRKKLHYIFDENMEK